MKTAFIVAENAEQHCRKIIIREDALQRQPCRAVLSAVRFKSEFVKYIAYPKSNIGVIVYMVDLDFNQATAPANRIILFEISDISARF
jgi:hypothetical protein